jgi:hypothetical protein
MPLSEERKRSTLAAYDVQRGRLTRGAQAALVAGGLAKFTGRDKLAPAAAVVGGAVGYGDRVLEEKSQKMQDARMKKQSSAYDNSSKDLLTEGAAKGERETFQGVLETLFSKKSRLASLSDAQLKGLFPQTGKESYGHSRRAGLSAREASSRNAAAFRVE